MRIDDQGRKNVVRGCMCEWCAHKRELQRKNNILRELGRPRNVLPHEYQQARRKLKLFYSKGMSTMMMAKAMNMSDSTVTQVLAGIRLSRNVEVGTINRTTYDKIMALEFEAPPQIPGSGSRVPLAGTRRRLQALCTVGYGYTWIADQWGSNKAAAARLANEKRETAYVAWATAERVRELYEKYRDVKPEDAGVSGYCATRNRRMAAQRGYAPPTAWDDDTIDDPGAIPEWTGACGTVEGWRIHRRAGIPFCEPCREAKYAYERKYK